MLWNWCCPSVAICIRERKNKHQRLCFTGDGEELLTGPTSDDVQMLQDSWLTQKEASPSTSLATGSILSCAAPLAMLFACGIWENIFDICSYYRGVIEWNTIPNCCYAWISAIPTRKALYIICQVASNSNPLNYSCNFCGFSSWMEMRRPRLVLVGYSLHYFTFLPFDILLTIETLITFWFPWTSLILFS